MTDPHPLAREAIKYGALWVEGGPLDGWVSWRGIWMPVRIATPERVTPRSDFTPGQQHFTDACRKCSAPFLTWRTKADVISSLGARRPA